MPIVPSTKALRNIVYSGNDAEFADLIRVIPYAEVSQYGGRRRDGDRLEFFVSGHLLIGQSAQDLSGPGRDALPTVLPSGKAELFVDPVGFPQILSVQSKDRIRAVDRAGQPEFEIERADPHGRGRVYILLTRL